MKILGICGSLRKDSSNSNLLKAAKLELSEHQWLDFELAKLPYFDPELQYADELPPTVAQVRGLAKEADLIFVCTPEYAHGIPGILKNAFEWIFHEGTQKKPVFVVIGSPQGESTRKQLIEVLTTMDFIVGESHTLLIQGARTVINKDGKFSDALAEKSFIDFCRTVIY